MVVQVDVLVLSSTTLLFSFYSFPHLFNGWIGATTGVHISDLTDRASVLDLLEYRIQIVIHRSDTTCHDPAYQIRLLKRLNYWIGLLAGRSGSWSGKYQDRTTGKRRAKFAKRRLLYIPCISSSFATGLQLKWLFWELTGILWNRRTWSGTVPVRSGTARQDLRRRFKRETSLTGLWELSYGLDFITSATISSLLYSIQVVVYVYESTCQSVKEVELQSWARWLSCSQWTLTFHCWFPVHKHGTGAFIRKGLTFLSYHAINLLLIELI
jgi:hypothetical protein